VRLSPFLYFVFFEAFGDVEEETRKQAASRNRLFDCETHPAVGGRHGARECPYEACGAQLADNEDAVYLRRVTTLDSLDGAAQEHTQGDAVRPDRVLRGTRGPVKLPHVDAAGCGL
jgi:hypothetical protein